MKASIATIANKYLQLSYHKIDSKNFQLQLETHPEFPSLKSLSDTFDYFGIENIVAKVPQEALEQLPDYFISLLEKEDKVQLFLVQKTKNSVITIDENLQKERWSFELFKEKWEGTIIAIEINSSNSNPVKLFDFKNAGYFLLGITVLATIFINTFQVIIYSILSLAGFAISYFIVQESMGIYNKAVSKVCEAVSKTGGCNKVINAGSVKFGPISLSDICFVYFSSLFLVTVFIGFDYSFFFCLSLLSIPVIVYSLLYQGFVLKEWCTLCLGISTVLLLQTIFLADHFQELFFDFKFVLKAMVLSSFVLLFWILLKKLWINNLKLEKVETDFLKFKRNKTLFETLLKKERLIDGDFIPEPERITFGSKNPKIRIDAVTNPLCGYCEASFMSYYKLLKEYKSIQVHFIFTMFSSQIDNPAYKIIQSVLTIYDQQGEEKALTALYEWFKERNFETWNLKFGLKSSNDVVLETINQHANWASINAISFTPTTIVNGYFFPKEYAVEDLSLFIDDMLLEQNEYIFETN